MRARKNIGLILLTSLILLFGMINPSDGTEPRSHFISVTGDNIIVQTKTVSLTLSISKKGAIVGLSNRLTGQVLKIDATDPLSSVVWMIDGTPSGDSNSSEIRGKPHQFSYIINDEVESSSLNLRWQNPSLLAEAIITAAEEGWISMSLDILNHDQELTIRRVFFPCFIGIQSIGESGANDLIAVPEREGYVIENATSSIVERPWDAEYPGTLSMQFVYLYESGGGGFYIGIHDNESNYKGIQLFRSSSQAYLFNWYHYATNIKKGNSFIMDYSVFLMGAEGDNWQSGAQIYKEWALKQWYVQKGPVSERSDIPKWVKNLDLVWATSSTLPDQGTGSVTSDGETATEIPYFSEEIKNNFPNASLMLFWFGWNRDGFDRGYPEYYPPRGGESVFKQAIEGAHEQGLKVMLYFNGMVIHVDTETYKKAQPYLTIDEDGNVYMGKCPNNTTNVTPDPSSDWWKSTVVDFGVVAVRDYNADGVYVDQISTASPKLDFSSDRGHDPGGGSWWWREERALLQSLREEIRKYNPEAIISSENVLEVYIPEIDVFQSYDHLYDFRDWYPKGHSAPIFSFVYHGYALQYLIFLNTETGFPVEGGSQFTHGITEALVRGYIPGVDILPYQLHLSGFIERSRVFLNTIIRTRQAFKEFLTYGLPLQPPIHNTQSATFIGDTYTEGVKILQDRAVASGTFQIGDGRTIIMLANRLGQTKEVSFNQGLGSGDQTVLITEALNEAIIGIRSMAASEPFNILVPSYSIKTLMIESVDRLESVRCNDGDFQMLIATSSEILQVEHGPPEKPISIVVNETENNGYIHLLLPPSHGGERYIARMDGMTQTVSIFESPTYTSLIIKYMQGGHTISLQRQFFLDIKTEVGTLLGSGWHDAGSTVPIGLTETMIDIDAGTRAVFVGWSGDINRVENKNTIIMDKHKNVTANWIRYHSTSLFFMNNHGSKVLSEEPLKVTLTGPRTLTTNSYSGLWLDQGVWRVEQIVWNGINIASPGIELQVYSPGELRLLTLVYPLKMLTIGERGQVLSGVKVTLIREGAFFAETISDQHGVAEFEEVPLTDYEVFVSYKGFQVSKPMLDEELETEHFLIRLGIYLEIFGVALAFNDFTLLLLVVALAASVVVAVKFYKRW